MVICFIMSLCVAHATEVLLLFLCTCGNIVFIACIVNFNFGVNQSGHTEFKITFTMPVTLWFNTIKLALPKSHGTGILSVRLLC